MDALEFVELKKEVKRIERNVSRCNALFVNADNYATRYAAKGKLDDLNLALENKRTCLRLVVVTEDVCRRVAEAFAELSIFDDATLYGEVFKLLTISQEVVRDCCQWYRELCETIDRFLFID